MRLGPKSCVVVVLLALFFVGGATGQTVSSGALSGVVIDKTNAVVPDASVEISDVTKGTTDLTKKNGEGVYQFSFRNNVFFRHFLNWFSPDLLIQLLPAVRCFSFGRPLRDMGNIRRFDRRLLPNS